MDYAEKLFALSHVQDALLFHVSPPSMSLTRNTSTASSNSPVLTMYINGYRAEVTIEEHALVLRWGSPSESGPGRTTEIGSTGHPPNVSADAIAWTLGISATPRRAGTSSSYPAMSGNAQNEYLAGGATNSAGYGKATASWILGLIGWFLATIPLIGFALGIPAIVLAAQTINTHKTPAIIGLISGIITVLLAIFWNLAYLTGI